MMSTKTIDERRAKLAAALGSNNDVVLIAAGESIGIPGGLDQVFPFRPHPEHYWLTGVECPGAVLAFDSQDRSWTHFVPIVSELEKVWEGREQTEGVPLAELPAWIAARRGRPIINLGAELQGVRSDAARVGSLRDVFSHTRRPKDRSEVDLIMHAVRASAAGFSKGRSMIRPGMTERSVEIEIEAEFFRSGADRTAYDTIVGGGPNSVVFHFTPSSRPFAKDEMVLIDAGAEVAGYCADVTRTYPSSGTFAPLQREVYSIVLASQENAVSQCTVGREWRDVHLECCREMARGLLDLGVLQGSPEGLVEQGVMALFFPHGIGHMVGLGVRDAGGKLPGRANRPTPGGINLRVDLPLEAGYVITVEPGLYFIPAILRDAARREKFRSIVNWDRVDRDFMNLGGIRIEDNVHVTPDGPENLTVSIPKRLHEIES